MAHLRLGQQPAQPRPDDETQAERRPDQPHPPRPLLRRRHIGHIALDRRNIARPQSGEQPHRDGQPDVGHKGQHQIAQRIGHQRHQQHRLSPDPIRQPPPERLGEKLPQRIGREHQRDLPRLGLQALGEEGQQRHHQPKPDQVDEHHGKQHGQGGCRNFRRSGRRRHADDLARRRPTSEADCSPPETAPSRAAPSAGCRPATSSDPRLPVRSSPPAFPRAASPRP